MVASPDPPFVGVACQPDALAGRRVLLVEDAPFDRRLFATLLTRAGAEVVLECSGQAAVERAFPRRGTAVRFDAVLMVLSTPNDAADATAALRARGYAGPVLVVAAQDRPADAARCLAAGCDRLLAKPIDHGRLFAALAEGLTNPGRRRPEYVG